MKRSNLMIFAVLSLTLATPARAQDWPSRPITLIVPFAAGGGVDVSARIQAQGMSERLGQPVVVENMGGAGGMTGALRVAKADPDGYTLLIGNSGTQAFSQPLRKTPPYNSVTDFTPVGLASESPRILIARKDLPASNLQEFIAYVKLNQSKMQFGSAGVGSGTHLPCVLLNMAMGVTVTHVPYRGEGPAQQDLIGGRVDYMCSTIQTGAALAKQNEVRGQGHRRDVAAPGQDHSGRADDRRTGAAQCRGERLERVLPAAEYAGPDRAEAQQGDERYARRSGGQ
jgi:tripartite-type tricarboxylate transporter receptor subunit TctC